MKTPNEYACLGKARVTHGDNRTALRLSAVNGFHLSILLLLVPIVLWIAGCGGGGSGSGITIEVQPNAPQTMDEGEQQTFTAFISDPQNRGFTWSLSGTGTGGSGCAGNGCGTLSSTSQSPTTYTAPTGLAANLSVTLKCVANGDSSVSVSVAITVVLPPTFQTPPQVLPNGSNGVPYSQKIVGTGGVAPLTFTLNSGGLPAGLQLNTDGSIVGRPSGPGPGPNPALFTVKVTDNVTNPVPVISPQFSISISPAPTLSITSAGALTPATLHAQYSTRINTSGGVPPFRWTIPPGTLPPGLTLDANSGSISGVPTLAGTFPFTPTVQDSTIPPQVVSTPAPLSITVSPPPPLQITTPSLPAGQTLSPYTGSVAVTGGVAPYTWALLSGQLPSGLVLNASTGQISGTPVLVTTSIFTIQVTDSEIPALSQSKQFTVDISAGATDPNNLLKGAYTFLFQGFDAQGPVLYAGTFLANGAGKITSGTADLNRNSGAQSGVTSGATLTGTYAIGTDGRGTMTLTATNAQLQTLVSEYQLVFDSAGNARFFENDANNATPPAIPTHGAGILRQQSGSNFAAANFSGNFGFSFSGRDFNNTPAALVGFIHADGNLTLSPGRVDVNDAAAYSPAVPLSGNFSVTSATGRGLASLIYAVPGSAQTTLDFAFYFVSPTDLFFVSADQADSAHPLLAGEMLLQNPSTKFDATALTGSSIASGTGLDTNASAFVGRLLAADPACVNPSNISFIFNQNDGGAITAPAAACGTYSVDSNGRVSFTNLGSRVAAAYLTDQNQAFLIGSDTPATTGLIEPQTGAPFSTGSVQGGYTLSAPFTSEKKVKSLAGQLNCLLGNGIMTGTVDEVDADGTPNTTPSATLTFTLTDVSRGRGTVTTNTALLPATLAYYIVSPSKIRLISTDAADQHPEVIFLDH